MALTERKRKRAPDGANKLNDRIAQENEQSRAWDSGGPDERDGRHAGARDGAEEPGGAVPRLGARCTGKEGWGWGGEDMVKDH